MAEEKKAKEECCVSKYGGCETLGCGIWAIGWLFTIGFAQLVWWKAIIALIFWPYYLGAMLK